MVGTPTSTGVPPEMHHHTVSDNQVRAATLMRCFVLSAARKAIMPITAGTETFQETGEELRGDDSMVMITSTIIDYFLFRLSYRNAI